MSLITNIDVVILTLNEERNIGRVLEALTKFSSIVIVDSGSSDRTLEIASRYPSVRVVQRQFDSHSAQWNYGIHETGLTREWTLALDADYVLSSALVSEVEQLVPSNEVSGYETSFVYCINGRPLRSGLYPPVVTLFRRDRARYVQRGHTQKVALDGVIKRLHAFVCHDDRKPLGRWLAAQRRYASAEAAWIVRRPWSELRLQDRVRRLAFIAPWLVPLYCLTVRGGIFDGWAGIYYSVQRGIAEAFISLRLIEQIFRRPGAEHQ